MTRSKTSGQRAALGSQIFGWSKIRRDRTNRIFKILRSNPSWDLPFGSTMYTNCNKCEYRSSFACQRLWWWQTLSQSNHCYALSKSSTEGSSVPMTSQRQINTMGRGAPVHPDDLQAKKKTVPWTSKCLQTVIVWTRLGSRLRRCDRGFHGGQKGIRHLAHLLSAASHLSFAATLVN